MSEQVYKNQINHPNSDNELRDRIAATLDRNFNTGGYLAKIKSAMLRDYAQAIIDDLGLRVEEANAETKRTDGNGITWYDVHPYKKMTRVVGKWEAEK